MEKLKCARYVEGSKKKKKKKKRERDLLNQIFYRTAIEDTFLMISWDKIALLWIIHSLRHGIRHLWGGGES